MQNFFKEKWFVLIAAGICTFAIVFILCLAVSRPTAPVAERTPTECLDGFEYYARTFNTHHGTGVALAPKWDRDGKPRRCQSEKEKP